VEVKSLCKQLKRVADERNDVAHNPMSVDSKGGNPCILVTRMKYKDLSEKDLRQTPQRVQEAKEKLKELMYSPKAQPKTKP
jgi:hypothetical protein